jgi:hypothetical protein
VQQNLRHLQRSLKSDDLDRLWDKLDIVIRDAVGRIRGLPRPTDHFYLLSVVRYEPAR